MTQLGIWAIDVISAIGYPGITLLIALESILPILPSEIVLALSGSLSASGRFNIFVVLLVSLLGSLSGASFWYAVARWNGETRLGDWLDLYGKWLLLSRADLDSSRRWFARYGAVTVAACRVIPGMRTIVSVPAGLTGMPYGRFLLFTALGSSIWNGTLILAGYLLGKNWSQVEGWLAPFGPIVYGFIALLVIIFVARRLWARFGYTGSR